jgi:hypothetical protein
MKKLLFSLTALALCAMMFTSCKKDKNDDDKEESKISTLSATVNDGSFSTSAAAFYSSSSSEAGTSKLPQILGSTSGSTTIAGTANGKQLAITIKGTTSGTYNLNVSADASINNTLIKILSGESVTDIIKDAVNVETDAMIIYRTAGATEGSNDYWFSTKASVTFDNSLVLYATGNFTATMRNKNNDTFEITDGKYKVFGKPVTSK